MLSQWVPGSGAKNTCAVPAEYLGGADGYAGPKSYLLSHELVVSGYEKTVHGSNTRVFGFPEKGHLGWVPKDE